MSSTAALQAGLAALQEKRFADAVKALEAYCQQESTKTRNYFQAQMYLVRAYQENEQLVEAIALCQQMAMSGHPQIKGWAERTLPLLTATPLDTPTADSIVADSDPTNYPPEEELAKCLNAGNAALKAQRFDEAIAALESFCKGANPHHKNYAQAQMWLVKAYIGSNQTAAAIALCQRLVDHDKDYVQIWAQRMLATLAPDLAASAEHDDDSSEDTLIAPPSTSSPKSLPKAGRSAKRGVSLAMKGVAANLALASGVTLSLLTGMLLMLFFGLMLIHGSKNPTVGFFISVVLAIVFNGFVFFLSPLLMDLMQNWLYGTRWTTLSELQRHSPEAAKVLLDVCKKHKLAEPRLGIIEDDNPTAFTYGSLPNTARLVVSRGLFKYLDDDEIATVYAHELGHIVHWDFAVMTLAATLVQLTYLVYIYTRELATSLGDDDISQKIKDAAKTASVVGYFFYVAGEYLLLYLSRTREYYADHFAAETTGNPNALSRALVKIAYGILEEGQRHPGEPSKVLQGTRALGISDAKSAAFTGTAYRVASEPVKIGRVFLWDMFNPWAKWIELNSTHPLTGKRVRALTTYAEQLGLDTEFNMAQVVREGKSLNKARLYSHFVRDVLVYWANWLGLAIGLVFGSLLGVGLGAGWKPIVFLTLVCFGAGTLLKTVFMYPDFRKAPATDVLTLMSDPYASPLRGRPVRLEGTVIGRGDAGYQYGSDLKLQDPTGMIFLRYSSRFGPLGNFLFGMSQAQSFINQEVKVLGWFRRSIMPWVDLVQMDCANKWSVDSYHRFWELLLGGGAIALGFVIPTLVR
jgi:Zn-dependent protease with chaperone function